MGARPPVEGRPMMVRILDPPGRYLSWGQWRAYRRRRPALGAFCPICWGQRRIYEPFLGGGLIPIVCDGCAGTGRV